MRISNHLTRHFLLQTNNGRITQLKKRLHVDKRQNKERKFFQKKTEEFFYVVFLFFCVSEIRMEKMKRINQKTTQRIRYPMFIDIL